MPKKRNKPGTRPIEKRLMIFCEGMKDKSESAYFKALIRSCKFKGERVIVKVIDSKKNTGKELVREAINKREFPHDILWVVYDKDGYTKHPDTFDLARKKNINIGFSSISFEYWILLHYKYTSRPFAKSEDIIKYLKENDYIDYEKGDIDIYDRTHSMLNTAKVNAKSIQKHQIKSNPINTPIYTINPYTNLNELISEIENLEQPINPK